MRGEELSVTRIGERVLIVEPAPLGAAERLMAARPDWLADAWACGKRLALELAAPVLQSDILRALDAIAVEAEPPREIEIPTVYDGPDMGEVARLCGVTPDEVAELHSAAPHTCAFIGFCPGFGYLDGLPVSLAGLPRRTSPRTRVPAGSVAIAGERSAVYPLDRPGGWWIIGRTEMRLVDVGAGFFALGAGDRVRFRRVG